MLHLDYEDIGSRIKKSRNDAGFSQAELAEMVSVNCEHISRVETGKKAVSLELLVKIANSLQVTADDLLVINLTAKKSEAGEEIREIIELLQYCNNDEKVILKRMLVFMKKLLTEFGI